MTGRAKRQPKNVPSKSTPMVRQNSSIAISVTLPSPGVAPPALL
jgi:hypothetical protein